MGHSNSKGRLLIVDDDYSVCTLLVDKLASDGYECESCPEGELALDLMKRRAFDALVLDLMIPGVTGLEILVTAKRMYPRTAFIIVTGVDDVKVAEQALRQGADDYLVKPIHLKELAASVTRAIDRKRRTGESADKPLPE